MKKLLVLLLLSLITMSYVLADEGMWIPILMKKYNIEDMQAKGFKLSAEDIYSVNQASMKDAIVIFGRGCTGEMISEQGLLITNHHCGYGQIQKHSSLEHDYLRNGFWAMSREEELANPELQVTFLKSMEDVTGKVLAGVDDKMLESERKQIINKNIEEIKKDAVKDTHYNARIEGFFCDNQYFLFINEIFTDVRLVGAPPSAIGKFGGDTDNWMWPRHTGDFSLFRVYADKDGKPAKYSSENMPLKPKKYFPISLKGAEKGDFTMVFGYPGTTTQYLPSFVVENIEKNIDPSIISIRDKKLEIINAAMNADDLVRIQYSSKAASIANGWKKWKGEIKGLKRLNAVEKKKSFERNFQEWANSTPELKAKYTNLLNDYQKVYEEQSKYKLRSIFTSEAGFASDAVSLAIKMRILEKIKDADKANIELLKPEVLALTKGHFKDYNEDLDKKMFAEMLKIYLENSSQEFNTIFYKDFLIRTKKAENKYLAYADYCYEKSVFAKQEKFEEFLNNLSVKSYKKLSKDPIYAYMKDVVNQYVLQSGKISEYGLKLDSLNRIYMKAQMEYQSNKLFYPDANFTLRITYGQVDGYFPADGVQYDYYTTLDGIMEKDNPEIFDYDVPAKLKELYAKKDYGRYADKDGKIRVAFIGTNHTTGGNSGSPVVNANGELIGLNFDRNWEGTMSDIMYDPAMCRNITIDIRYALFIVDKYAGASHIIDELTIVE